MTINEKIDNEILTIGEKNADIINVKKQKNFIKKDEIIAYTIDTADKISESTVKYIAQYGADIVFIEGIKDIAKTKEAVIAVKEACVLPIFVTSNVENLTVDEAAAVAVMLDGLGVSAFGIECDGEIDEKSIEIVKIYRKYTNRPIIVNNLNNLNNVNNLNNEEKKFSNKIISLYEAGASIFGGNCEKIKNLIGNKRKHFEYEKKTTASFCTHVVTFEDKFITIGERINPTGKNKLKEAIKNGDIEYIKEEGLKQKSAGVDILDVNLGLPEIDEGKMLKKVVTSLQKEWDLPLQLDFSKPEAPEPAMRAYIGKPIVNSMTGERKSMEFILPLVKKYGGIIIALTMDEGGIPKTWAQRVKIAEKILKTAEKYGYTGEDIIFDALALPVVADINNGQVTLETVKRLSEMGLKTIIGISNVSFGLPKREIINVTFLEMAKNAGLSAAIINPFDKMPENAEKKYAENLLLGKDEYCLEYIEYARSIDF